MAVDYLRRIILGSEKLELKQEANTGEQHVIAYGKTNGGVITPLLVDAIGKLIVSS